MIQPRSYTIQEITDLRKVVRNYLLFDRYTEGSGGCRSHQYREPDLTVAVEEQVRTWMQAGVTADDLVAQDTWNLPGYKTLKPSSKALNDAFHDLFGYGHAACTQECCTCRQHPGHPNKLVGVEHWWERKDFMMRDPNSGEIVNCENCEFYLFRPNTDQIVEAQITVLDGQGSVSASDGVYDLMAIRPEPERKITQRIRFCIDDVYRPVPKAVCND